MTNYRIVLAADDEPETPVAISMNLLPRIMERELP
jgi:hypothetical protein